MNDFPFLPPLSPQLIRQQQFLLVARRLLDECGDPPFHRLCQLGGFVIRGVDLETDVKHYLEELYRLRHLALFQMSNIRSDKLENIHQYVMNHIGDYVRDRFSSSPKPY